MALFGRYDRDSLIALGTQLGTARATAGVRKAIRNGTLPIAKSITTCEADRLDSLAGSIYGDSRFWWVLAAASNIGWGLQVPPGTVINIVNLALVETLVSNG